MTRVAHRWALTALALTTLAACTPSEPVATPSAPVDESATPTPTPSEDTAAVEAAVLDVYHRYWAATVAAQRGNPDPALFEDNTSGEQFEKELQKARENEELGIVREGEPVITDVTTALDEGSAVVTACVDHTEWVPEGMTGESVGTIPVSLQLEEVDGAWFVTDYVEAPAAFTC